MTTCRTFLIDGREVKTSKVSSIKPLGKRLTYDITVAYHHNFYANGVLVHNCLLDRIGAETGQDLYRFKDTFVAYKHRRLEFKAASPNKKTLRGRTRVITLLDEIGWLDANIETSGDKIKYNAKEIHGALDRSLLTVRNAAYKLTTVGGMNDIPTGMAINISSISDARDMICYLVNQAQHSNTILGVRAATWDVNPHVPRDDPQIIEDYRKNPVNADRDYGSIAPVAENPFFGNFSRIQGCFTGKENGLLMQYRKHKFPDGSLARYTELITCTESKKRSILAIDAGYCVSAESLVPTEYGLLRIEEMADCPEEAPEGWSTDLTMKVGGSKNPAKTARWYYSGRKQTYRVVTASGHYIDATRQHKFQVLRENEHQWVELENLKKGDLLCFNMRQPLRTRRLGLSLSEPNSHLSDANSYRFSKEVTKPAFMTPDLAFLLGAIVSEGHFNKYRVSVANSNPEFLGRLKDCFKSVFGVECLEVAVGYAGQKMIINGKSTKCNVQCKELIVSSVNICRWLVELGVLSSEEHGRKSSYHKVVPASILQSDASSQAAFMAAYVEGDGSVRSERAEITVWSKSRELLHQMQAMLGAHGVMANLKGDALTTASSYDGKLLYAVMETYLTFKGKHFGESSYKLSNKRGFPAKHFFEFMDSRVLHSNRYGTHFTTDCSTVIQGSYSEIKRTVRDQFLRDAYERGDYTELLCLLKKVSATEHSKLIALLNSEYRYSPVVSTRKYKVEHVYDLSIAEPSDPAFIANGMVVHNSNNCFGFCIGHVNDEGYPVIQIMGEIQPLPGMVVDHTMILNHLISPLIEKCHVSLVLSDRWQNIKFLQDIQHEFPEVEAKPWSCRYSDFVTVRQHMWDNEVVLPVLDFEIDDVLDFDPDEYPQIFANDPMKHFVLQLRTVRDLGNGVGKGSQLTDDIFRAFVLCTCYLVDQDTYDYYLAEEVPDDELQRPSFIGFTATATGMGRGGGGESTVKSTSDGRFMGYSASQRRG